jgi:hypothetical protein
MNKTAILTSVRSVRRALLTAVFVTGCYGSGATTSGGTTTGAGGTSASGSGGAGTGGTSSGEGGATSTGSGGSTTTGTGGTVSTGTGGDSSSGSGGTGSFGTGGLPGTGGTATSGAGGRGGSGVGGSGATGAGGSGATGAGGTVATGTGGTTSPGAGGTGAGPSWGTPVAGGPTGSGVAATVTVNLNSTVGTIGPGFGGFSYEKTHITNDSLNSTNTNLIALYKLVGSPVMRLGADDVDNCNWTGTGTAPTQPSGAPFARSITTGMVDQLCNFLQATGTKIIYGVNYKSNNATASAAEAAYAQGKCGASILGFEIGNEINRFESPLYDWDTIKAQYESIATAVLATPGVLLVGPAGGGGDALSLSTPFAADESAKFGDKLVLLTQHYYAGTAGSTTATVARLQTPDPDSATSQAGLVGTLSTMNTAATTNKIPQGYRCGECNTFAGHGQMGVSDTLIAGLWGLDLMFVTAEHGGSGVNLHGGETGMDGSRPFYYEPIMEDKGAVVGVQPIYYSLLFLNLASQGPMVSTTVTTSNPNFTAYTVKANGFTSVVLDNKSATMAVSATVNIGAAVSSASAIYLQGTPGGSLTAPAGSVTLAGATVSTAGVWNRNPPYTQTTSGNTVSVYVPAASAALVRVLQ